MIELHLDDSRSAPARPGRCSSGALAEARERPAASRAGSSPAKPSGTADRRPVRARSKKAAPPARRRRRLLQDRHQHLGDRLRLKPCSAPDQQKQHERRREGSCRHRLSSSAEAASARRHAAAPRDRPAPSCRRRHRPRPRATVRRAPAPRRARSGHRRPRSAARSRG